VSCIGAFGFALLPLDDSDVVEESVLLSTLVPFNGTGDKSMTEGVVEVLLLSLAIVCVVALSERVALAGAA